MARSISARFGTLRASARRALIPYLACGYPTGRRFVETATRLEGLGADLLEIGIPHSDPLADGPTIRFASNVALESGLTVAHAFQLIEKVAVRVSIPLIAMTYVNLVLRQGRATFARRCRNAGISGVIIPDLTYEDSRDFRSAFSEFGLDLVLLTAPTTPPERVAKIATSSRGFLYLVSVTGITGARRALPAGLAKSIRRARAVSPNPVCVGFGVSRGEQARMIGREADGVIVGSALIDRIRQSGNGREANTAVSRLMKDLRRGLDR